MNANAVNVINVDQVVENSRFGAFQFGLLALCGLCLIIDGFDVQAMGYVAPAIIGDWGVSKASLGPVFGAGLFGMLLGSLVLTPVGDRLGRRPVLIISTFFFAACMLLTNPGHHHRQLAGIALHHRLRSRQHHAECHGAGR